MASNISTTLLLLYISLFRKRSTQLFTCINKCIAMCLFVPLGAAGVYISASLHVHVHAD